MNFPFERYAQILEKEQLQLRMGKVKKVIGLIIHAVGLKVFVGEVCDILISEENRIPAEVVGFEDDGVLLMPLGDLQGIGPGCLVLPTGKALVVRVGDDLLGTPWMAWAGPWTVKPADWKATETSTACPPIPFSEKRSKRS